MYPRTAWWAIRMILQLCSTDQSRIAMRTMHGANAGHSLFADVGKHEPGVPPVSTLRPGKPQPSPNLESSQAKYLHFPHKQKSHLRTREDGILDSCSSRSPSHLHHFCF